MTAMDLRTEEDVQAFLPVYVAVDTSASMNQVTESGQLQIDVANEIVPAIVEVCEERPTVRDKLRLSLVSFNSDAEVVVPLGGKEDFVPPPVLSASGGTNYGALFKLLRSEIEDGVRALNTGGFRVYRPAVFMITDGEPNDPEPTRAAAFSSLVDPAFKAAPHVVMFGVADASPSTLKAYINRNGVAVGAKSGADAAEGLKAIISLLVSSIVASTSGDSDHAGFQFDAGDIDSDLLTVWD
jgi:uncharacterized protein YegL